MISNQPLGLVRTSVRSQALESFEFLANYVLNLSLSEELCTYITDAVEDKEDVEIKTNRPRTVLYAIHSWLHLHGTAVLTTTPVPKSESLSWIHEHSEKGAAVCLDLTDKAVVVKWL